MIPRHRRWRRLFRFGGITLGGLLALGALALAGAWFVMKRSLPRDGGTVALASLSAPVTVERDALGAPMITGETLIDVALAQGFVDAQERFFQMDLSRRYAAGELAALLGAAALPMDRQMRRYLFRSKAEVLLAMLPARHRRMLEAYAAGVNAGIADLPARPPEYLALRAEPAPWLPEDGALVMYLMFRSLNFNDRSELSLGVMREALPPEVFEFLTPDHAPSDPPPLLVKNPNRHAALHAPLEIPGPEVIDLRGERQRRRDPAPVVEEAPQPVGSNGWAVAGVRTRDGRAILANDMHLGLTVPSTWRRVTLRWSEDGFASGVSLPGVPGIVAGSNGRVAWGHTNAYGDFQDYRVIEVDPENPSQYRTRDGWATFGEVLAEIEVKGGRTVRESYRTTRYGVVIEEDHRGRPMALDWAAMNPERTNLAILDMLDAQTLEEAVEVAGSWWGPPQNVMLASADGRIAWTLSGWLPNRVGSDGRTPTLATEARWDGALDKSLRPVVIEPSSGRLATANARPVGLPESRLFGRQWARGDRASRIMQLLEEGDAFDESDMLRIQLDTRMAGLDVWRDLALAGAGDDPELAEAKSLIEAWGGAADADERGHRLLRAFRSEAMDLALAPLLAPCREIDPDFSYRWSLSEAPALRLLLDRPAHLLAPDYESWEALLRAALERALADLRRDDAPIDAPWGEVNATSLRHPLTAAAPALRPWLSWLLDMPRREQPGDTGAVRVARPSFGASERIVVSPGREADGVLHLPTGASGHPLSEHYGDQFPDWVEGKPTPFLPGETVSSFTLTPAP